MRRTLLLFVTLLGGCASYHAQPIDPAQLARQFEARSLDDRGLHSYLDTAVGRELAWPLGRWDQNLLTLAARYFGPSMDLARAQWNTAQAGIKVANTIPNPTLQFPLQFSFPNPGPGNPLTWGPSLDIPIETAGKRAYRTDQATHLANSARLNMAAEAWKTHAQVRNAMLAVYAAHARAALLSSRADALRDIVRMIEKRRAVGETSGPDVSATELVLAQAQSDLSAARTGENEARVQLAVAIGVPSRALAGVQLNLDTFGAPPPAPREANALRDTILQRPDLLASLSDYAAAESALQLEVARQYPDIHLGPGYTYDTGTHRISFGLGSVTLPIFDQNQGGIAQAEAKRKEAAARTAALQDSILGDLDLNLNRYQASLSAMRNADRRLAIARQQLDSQAADFAVGSTDRLSWTQAKADFVTSQLASLDALVSAQQVAGQLEDTLQRPLADQSLSRMKASLTEQDSQL